MQGHLRRSRLEKVLNVFQRIRLRLFRACGLASGLASFASLRRDSPTGSWLGQVFWLVVRPTTHAFPARTPWRPRPVAYR